MKKYILVFAAVFALSSCAKFLEPKSQSEFVPKTAEAFDELLLGSGYPTRGRNMEGLFEFNDIFCDDVASTTRKIAMENMNNTETLIWSKALFGWSPGLQELITDLGTGTNATTLTIWKLYYRLIKGCNAVLDYIDKESVSGSTELKNYVKGQAHFLRAFYYFTLAGLFADPYTYDQTAPGIPLRLTSNFDLEDLPRNTIADTYAQILKDLDAAEEGFLNGPQDKLFVKDYRVNLPAVQLLKTRVYLYMENYDMVKTYSEKLMNDWDMFSLRDLNSFSTSTSDPFYYNAFNTYNNPEVIWAYGSTNDKFRLTDMYGYTATTGAGTSYKLLVASPELLALYEPGGGAIDRRLAQYISIEGTSAALKLVKMPYGKMAASATLVTDYTYFGFSFRLAEVYLNYVEAKLFGTPKDEAGAVELLNELRKHRLSTGSNYEVPADSRTGDKLIKFYKEERRRELCFEGHRWQDMRRWGMESFSRIWYPGETDTNGVTLTMEKNDPCYTLPIPTEVLDRNPLMTPNRKGTNKY